MELVLTLLAAAAMMPGLTSVQRATLPRDGEDPVRTPLFISCPS